MHRPGDLAAVARKASQTEDGQRAEADLRGARVEQPDTGAVEAGQRRVHARQRRAPLHHPPRAQRAPAATREVGERRLRLRHKAGCDDEARVCQPADHLGDRGRCEAFVDREVVERQVAQRMRAVQPLPDEPTQRREAEVCARAPDP